MQKAIGCIRVSTQSQADEGVSLAGQRAKVEAWCNLNDHELVAVFEDDCICGTSMGGRQGMHAALKAAGKGMAMVTCSIRGGTTAPVPRGGAAQRTFACWAPLMTARP
jgi:site-specific DNA recombinase